ncbi:ovarian cancer G-protein coupled receptor 1-like [Trichomycterus rosablanca]|uniref:ovarian cancer G-protein coupled receptor 1-like n=1 Tax=Trichomycterus rosablanca TaxID=2290929 RepID=UPI002F357CD2
MASNESINEDEFSSLCTYNDTVDAYMYPTAYGLFFIFGLPGNCLSLYVAWVLMRRGNTLAVYLVSLSVSDLLYIITLPVWIMLAIRQPVNDTICSLIEVIMYNSFYVGSGLLCCISVDRYLAVVFPLHFTKVHKVRTAILVSTIVWLIEIVLHIGLLAYTSELQTFSSSRLCDTRIPMTTQSAHAAIVRAVLGFLIPTFLMAFCFQQIVVSLQKSVSTVASERQKIRNLLLLLFLIYMVSFTPFQVVMFLRGLLEPESCDYAKGFRDYYMVFVATTTINSVADPVVYCLMTESAKAEILRIFTSFRTQFHKTVSIMRSSSSSTA